MIFYSVPISRSYSRALYIITPVCLLKPFRGTQRAAHTALNLSRSDQSEKQSGDPAGNRTRDLSIMRPTPYHCATASPLKYNQGHYQDC